MASVYEQGRVKDKTAKGKTLCLSCYLYQHRQSSQRSFNLFLAFALAAVILVWTDDDAWPFFNFILFIISLYLSIVPHELGHALGALLVRMEILQIVIGAGPRVLSARLGNRHVELRMYPVEGIIICVNKHARFVRLKRFVMVLFGPLTNLAIAGLLWLFFQERINGTNFFKEVAPMSAFFLANIFMGIINLLPFTTRSAFGPTSSDGKQLLSLPFSPRKDFENYLSNYYVVSATLALAQNDYKACEKICAEGLARFPKNFRLISVKSNLLILNQEYHVARQLLADTIKNGEISYFEKALAENNIAWTDYLLGDPGLLDEADQLSRNAMEVLPWSLAVRSTRGAVLIEKNELEAGIGMLNDRRLEIESKTNRALALCSLAIGYAKSGRINESESVLSEARMLDAGCKLLPRAEIAISGAPGSLREPGIGK